MIVSMLTGLSFGIGISLLLFGLTFYYKSFFDETKFNNPLIPMSVSFVSITVGLSLLFGVFV